METRIFSEEVRAALILLLGLATLVFLSIYNRRKLYPPGPFPLPLIGNILSFVGKKSTSAVFEHFQKTYGNVLTLWFGMKPFVIVNGWDTIKEGLVEKRNDFNGRTHFITNDVIFKHGSDILMTDSQPVWNALRKIGFTAIRKYIGCKNLAQVCYENTIEAADAMLLEGQAFDPKDYVYRLINNITCIASVGHKAEKDNVNLLKLAFDTFMENAADGLPGDYIPFLRPLTYYKENRIDRASSEAYNFFFEKFKQHKKTYDPEIMRDFTDAVISSQWVAEKEELKYLTDENLCFVIQDLSFAGTDTSQNALKWIILYLSTYPDVQDRAYDEIKTKIGDRMPVQKDSEICDYTSSIILEALRLRSPAPMGLPHKTLCDTSLGGYNIPSGVAVLFNFQRVHLDDNHWKNAEDFHPDRFLDNGVLPVTKINYYAPFGVGKRACIGEKFAKLDIFLCLVALLQKCKIIFEGDLVDFRPAETSVVQEARPYKIRVEPRLAMN